MLNCKFVIESSVFIFPWHPYIHQPVKGLFVVIWRVKDEVLSEVMWYISKEYMRVELFFSTSHPKVNNSVISYVNVNEFLNCFEMYSVEIKNRPYISLGHDVAECSSWSHVDAA